MKYLDLYFHIFAKLPKQPSSIIESHGEEHILVNGVSGTVEGGEGEEYEKREEKSCQ